MNFMLRHFFSEFTCISNAQSRLFEGQGCVKTEKYPNPTCQPQWPTLLNEVETLVSNDSKI